MTKAIHHVQLDKWLICSEAAFQSLADFWRAETGPSSLLDWRLANQMIELVPLDRVTIRLAALASEGKQNIIVVADQAGIALLEQLELHADRLTIRLVEWGEAPLTAVLGMNAPDHAVLSALRNLGGEAETVELATKINDLEGYVAALSAWESACKESDGGGFSESMPAYANSAIPWVKLLNSSSNSNSEAAANDNWVELIQLAAATGRDDGKAVSLEDPSNKPAQWTLTLSPIDGGPSTLVVFRVNDATIQGFVGCRIRLRIRGDVIDLGEIDEGGQAEIILPSPIEMQGLAILWDEGK